MIFAIHATARFLLALIVAVILLILSIPITLIALIFQRG